jgi:NAD(P)-dependent dehydrogenase (short-subunit alcohol dehydrogenase family)
VTEREHEVAVVTGASGGVGRAVAHAFARRGAQVALLARGEESRREAAREVEQMGEAVLSRWDVTPLGTP